MKDTKFKSKKSAEMTIGTVIVIILALVVLVFLIFAFVRGGGSLMDYINNIFGGSSNVDTIKNACSTACAAQAQFAFCGEIRTLKLPDKTSYRGSCSTLGNGIESCSSIACGDTKPKKCSDVTGDASSVLTDKSCVSPQTNIFDQVGDSEGKDIIKFKYCCKSQTTTPPTPPSP
jgi:hypothetical protein